MIGAVVLTLAQGLARGAVAALERLLAILAAAIPWRPFRRTVRSISAGAEAAAEYGIYLVGWLCWGIDWLLRLPALALCARGGLRRGHLGVHGVVLASRLCDAPLALGEARRILGEAAARLEQEEITLHLLGLTLLPAPSTLRLPVCGVAGIFSRAFSWLSARTPGGSSSLTVFFAPDLGPVSGCSFPGTQWVLVDLQTDGTTLVHELCHLADAWRHSADPDNVMTDRPGGTHDRVTGRQRALIRTSRFVSRLEP